MVQVLAAMLRATRQRERRVLATGASVAAEEQVNQRINASPCDSAG